MKRIPKSFRLGGHTLTVKLIGEEEMRVKSKAKDDEEVYGYFEPDTLEIFLREPTRKLKRSIVIQTFWHEFFHAMFWVANHRWNDEKLVDQCGHLVHQFFDTAEF